MLVFSSNKENSAPFIREITTDFFGKFSYDVGLYTLSPVLSNYQSLHWVLPNVPSDDGMSMTYYTTTTGPYLYSHISTHIPKILSSENENSVPVYTDYDSVLRESEIRRSQIMFISNDVFDVTCEGYNIAPIATDGTDTVILEFMCNTELTANKYLITSDGSEPCVISILADYLVMAGLISVVLNIDGNIDETPVGSIEIQYDNELGCYMELNLSSVIPAQEYFCMLLPNVTIEE